MTFNLNQNRMFSDLKLAIKSDYSSLTSQANGGRSILFVYPPQEEKQFIAEAKQRHSGDFVFIDAREVFVSFIDTYGWDKFKELYSELEDELFKNDSFDDPTFFFFFLDIIKEAYDKGKIPALIHSGALFGTNFGNINLMEHPLIINSRIPFVTFYPATTENGNIKFLNKQIASKYRCLIIK